MEIQTKGYENAVLYGEKKRVEEKDDVLYVP
jgi:hypothetical protein